MMHNFMGDADQQDNRQNTPAAHEFKVEGREYPAPDQLHAFRSFYSNSLKDFATTARSERERIVESRDDSIARPTSGAGSDKPRTMRPQITTGRDGSDSTTTTLAGEVKELAREIFSPSRATSVSGPLDQTRSNPRNPPIQPIQPNAVAVAAAAYYYCNVTIRYVRSLIGTVGTCRYGSRRGLSRLNGGLEGNVTYRYVRLSEVAC